MISAVAWTRIHFAGVPVREPQPRTVIETLAALLACGFWYARDGEPWLHDVTLGPVHIQDFKHARVSGLRREITARFEGNTLRIEGQAMTAPAVAELFATDAAFARRCRSLPNYAGIFELLMREVPKANAPCAQHHDRQLILPYRGDVEIKKQLADEYED